MANISKSQQVGSNDSQSQIFFICSGACTTRTPNFTLPPLEPPQNVGRNQQKLPESIESTTHEVRRRSVVIRQRKEKSSDWQSQVRWTKRTTCPDIDGKTVYHASRFDASVYQALLQIRFIQIITHAATTKL